MCCRWQIFVHNNPEAEVKSLVTRKLQTDCMFYAAVRNSFWFLPQGYLENLEKTTSSVLSVIDN